MSIYEELGRAFGASRHAFGDYRAECTKFAGAFLRGFADYIECDPNRAFNFIPLKEPVKDDTTYTIPGAMHLDDDTYWHLGVLFCVYEKPNIDPPNQVLMRLKIKHLDDTYLVQIGDGQEYQIKDPTSEALRPIFDEIVAEMMDYYQSGLARFLRRQTKKTAMGFQSRIAK